MQVKTSLAVMTTLCAAALAFGQEQEQRRLLARRAAEADAYRKLAEAVYGVQLNARTYVKDFVTESDDIRAELDTFVRGIRLGEPRWFEDGSCEVPAEVTVAKVVETLRQAHDRYYKGDDVKTSDFESVTRRTEKGVLRVTGQGAPREDLSPDLPAGVAEQLGYHPSTGDPRPPVPDLWLKVGPQARLMALRAARVDALRRLAERIKGLRLTARTQVRDFVAESDVISTELNALLVGAQEVAEYLHDDELIAEVKLVVPTEQVITAIKSLHSRHYQDDDVRGSDIENVARSVVKRDFEATGMGVPPPQYIRKYAELTQRRLPEWVMQPVEADGQGNDPQMETPQGKLRAARAAELDARRKLAERIATLRIDESQSVSDRTRGRDEFGIAVDALIVDALVTHTRFSDGSALVTVSVPGMRIWDVVNDAPRP